MNLDRYISDDVIAKLEESPADSPGAVLRTVLPDILAQQEADIRREFECPNCGAVTRERMA